MIDLKTMLKNNRAEIRHDVCGSAYQFGRNCWLWLPNKSCHNPRVCLVAHIDTIHRDCRRKIYFDPVSRIYWSPDGLGADDRAGVWGCMALREKYGCMVLLTDGEEWGGLGAIEAARIFGNQFKKDVDFFIELDRRGRGQAVFYNWESDEFQKYILRFGFKKHFGTFSDISIVGSNLEIPSVNLSAGYYNEHRVNEYLIYPHLLLTLKKVGEILTEKRI